MKYFKCTRKWLFGKLDTWLNKKSEDASNVIVLIAVPCFGNSVFAAEECRRYSPNRKLAASVFWKFNMPACRNPQILIESFIN